MQLLSHYRDSLPPGSPLRDAYAEPGGVEGGLLPPLGLAVLGVLLLISGGIGAGLAAIVAAALWAFVLFKRSEAADAAKSAWANRRICLACTEQWTP